MKHKEKAVFGATIFACVFTAMGVCGIYNKSHLWVIIVCFVMAFIMAFVSAMWTGSTEDEIMGK